MVKHRSVSPAIQVTKLQFGILCYRILSCVATSVLRKSMLQQRHHELDENMHLVNKLTFHGRNLVSSCLEPILSIPFAL
jgi:hypothetical protein